MSSKPVGLHVQLIEQRSDDFPAEISIIDGSARRNIPFVRNLGVSRAKSEKLVFCDQDDVVQPGWLAAAHRYLDKEVAAMGLIRELTDPPSESARIMNPSVFTRRPIVETCNLAIRRSILQEVGGFDENLPAYGLDDAELSIRLRQAGYQIAGAQEMIIYAMGTSGIWRRIRKVYSSAKGEVYVWRKHRDLFGPELHWQHVGKEFMIAASLGARYILGKRDVPAEAIMRRLVTCVGHGVALPVHTKRLRAR